MTFCCEFDGFATNQKTTTKGSLQVRLRKQDFSQRINSDLKIEFAKQDLSSYSGLEFFRRYFALIKLNSRIKRAFADANVSGDYSVAHLIMVLVALWLTGGRRLRHIPFISEDPLVQRLCGLTALPSDRTVSRWLGQFTNDALQALIALNSEIVTEKLRAMNLARVTLDFDGTVLSCGDKVKWAARGYNPHNRHAKSLYPLLCHVAQTGHFLRVQNRPGDVHDSKRALEIIKSSVDTIRQALPGAVIEVRLDSAFFQEAIIKYLLREGIEFAIKVPMWKWLNLKNMIISRTRWSHENAKLAWFKRPVAIEAWGMDVEMTFYREKLSEKPKKDHQLDFFTPDDGVYEHSVIVSNKNVSAQTLLDFYNGRANMEHDIAEVKGEFGFDVIPCRDYQGNGAHQQISTLTYNLVRNFQLDVLSPKARTRSSSRTNLFELVSLKSLRFEMITAAGRLLNVSGEKILRLSQSTIRRQMFEKVQMSMDRFESRQKRAA
ncbi:MAG: IS1380 family transposase [Bdellovibrio sp.]|nr:IS1380 family transposase [Bdellovibrio sp.]